MLNRVRGHVDSADIIAEDDGRSMKGSMELLKKLVEPTTLGDSMSDGTVLCLSARARDCGLALGGPGDEVVAEVDTISRSGPASIGTTSPIGVRISSERSRGRGVQSKSEI
jgi:hypothetical protein